MAIADNVSADMSSSLVNQSEPIDDASLSAGSLLVDESEPIDQATVDDTYTPEVPQQFTREQLGKILGVSREAIRKWEVAGKLEKKGWEPVENTGSSPKNPRMYRSIAKQLYI